MSELALPIDSGLPATERLVRLAPLAAATGLIPYIRPVVAAL